MKPLIPLLIAALLSACSNLGYAANPVHMDGDRLVTDNGMTLYVFDQDLSTTSNCNGKCAENWPPLYASDPGETHGELAVIQRQDKTWQYTWRGMPLYHWSKDQKPGDTKGDGIGGVWHIAR